ncbi:MAG: hypothetical protein V2A76_05055 [Planctomycetota bacterium]
MGSLHVEWLRVWFAALTMLPGAAAFSQEETPPAPAPSAVQNVPAGAENAVRAALSAFPGATLEQVVTPSEAFGLGGEHDRFWTLRIRVDEALQTLKVGSDGVLLRGSKPVQTKDLPSTVASGMARLVPGGAAKITKLETFGIVQFVALREPETRYVARVANGSGATLLTVSPQGVLLDRKETKAPWKAPKVEKNPRTSDGPVPEPAARAVRAMREVFPDMVFDLVEEVPYIDSSTQTLVMLWYEVEFFVGGVKHEFNATPDGIVIEYKKTIPASALPQAASDAILEAATDGTLEEVTEYQTRAELRLVPLNLPVVVYQIEPLVETGARAKPIKLRFDGTEVKEPELPAWARPPEEEQGR